MVITFKQKWEEFKQKWEEYMSARGNTSNGYFKRADLFGMMLMSLVLGAMLQFISVFLVFTMIIGVIAFVIYHANSPVQIPKKYRGENNVKKMP